jgi:sulfur carrier protein ThiS
MSVLFRRAGLLTLLFFWTASPILSATDKTSGTLTVHDSLTAPNQPATIEATLTVKSLLTETGLGGEPIALLIAGNVVATAMTGGDGRALLSYTPKAKGAVPFTVRVGTTPRVAVVEAGANLAVWERRSPIMAVEVVSLMEDAVGQGPTVTWPGKDAEGRRPMPDAADELGKLTQFYYNILYVVTVDKASGSKDHVNAHVRQWLKDHKFPVGHILVLPSNPEALGAKLDEMHAAGWKSLKIGVGRTKTFAEAFLQRRLDAVMVPEPAKGEAPRKAKVAKEWKDVRKKM